MGKKNLNITLLIFLLLLLTSCSQGNNSKTNGDPQPEPSTENPNEKPTDKPDAKPGSAEKPDTNPGVKPAEKPDNNSSPNNPGPSSNPYEITKTNYTENNIKINYPQLTKSSDQQKEKTINQLLKKEAIKVLNYYLPEVQDLTLEINYEIKSKSPSLLSIQYTGVGYMNGAAHPNNHYYTTNIDIETGTILQLKDMINIDENFVGNLKQNAKSMKPEHQGILNSIHPSDLLNMLTNADSLDNIGTENQSDTFSYFTSDSLGISIPVSHAEGDHAEFEITYQAIAQNIHSLLLLSLLQQ
ncbi:PdaC/SigV domain-containing protein [Bacillus sp. ISL-46]|uniref:PdaC/SigV domain-containing protein n=1 Tax=Bacillus sp. ISL-46 TaxID=2819129 RepID=UPI001BE7454A|nr:DUF4163 domain-containing protein [Bacillus sp. ISL-46]MBT2723952.1 DUF4163 domain-containing protein [Bacillus sp. ISL-46]